LKAASNFRSVVRLVGEVFLRPDFEKKTFNNDLALVKLTDPVSGSTFDSLSLPVK
jgi:hypothetical protein